jgi:GNAT superfamily N-acetyltransferase
MPLPDIRLARVSDAEGIARLTSQLGYELQASAAAERLSRLLARPDHEFFVADVDGHVAGWLHATVLEYVESGPFVVIGGLVVDEDHRRKGVGRLLMEHAEAWARQQGCSIVRLWSSAARTAAHRFYEELGYTNIKTQYSFIKSLDGAGDPQLQMFIPAL